jgi:hypothetical protein
LPIVRRNTFVDTAVTVGRMADETLQIIGYNA